MLAAPDTRRRVERFANLFGERHFPLYAPYFEFALDDGDEPPWTWLRRGIPFQLMGFGYEGLHEMWHGYREGFSALALLVRPHDVYYDGPDGLRTAWLESAAEHIPRETLLSEFPKEAYLWRTSPGRSAGTRFEGAAQGRLLGAGRDRQLLSRRHCYDDGSYDGFCDPWEDESHRGRAPRSGARPTPSWTR